MFKKLGSLQLLTRDIELFPEDSTWSPFSCTPSDEKPIYNANVDTNSNAIRFVHFDIFEGCYAFCSMLLFFIFVHFVRIGFKFLCNSSSTSDIPIRALLRMHVQLEGCLIMFCSLTSGCNLISNGPRLFDCP